LLSTIPLSSLSVPARRSEIAAILAAGIVRHHCEASLDPTGPGLFYERFFNIEGDLLTIRTGADANIAHDGHYNLLHWRRVKA
jgi:hypothetical protein